MEPTTLDRIKTHRRTVLSSLWAFILLNMLFRDMHEFARPGWIEELMVMQVDQGLLLASGVLLTAFISMIVLSQILSRRAARWSNIGLAIVFILSSVVNPPGDLDDVWFFAVVLVGLVAIIALAWTWREESPAEVDTSLLTV